MIVCVCYFLGKYSFGGEKHHFGPPKGSGGKKLFSGPPKGSRRRRVGGEERKHSSGPPSRGKEEGKGSLQNSAALLL